MCASYPRGVKDLHKKDDWMNSANLYSPTISSQLCHSVIRDQKALSNFLILVIGSRDGIITDNV
jgi:hypothetical protein